ncbi:MAG: substrate-binding domain-containing protein [Acidimicrobiales bacterium]
MPSSSGPSARRARSSDSTRSAPSRRRSPAAWMPSRLRRRSTAVVAFNDLQAAGLVVAAHRAGVAVPDACSVVGSDGLDIAAMTAPGLTTVAAPLDALGDIAVEQLGAAARRGRSGVVTLTPRLVERHSTAAREGAVISAERRCGCAA